MNLQVFCLFFLITNIFGNKLMAQNLAHPTADSIYVHGNIYTGVVGDSSFQAVQRAEAMAIREDKILAVGSAAEVMKSKGPQTKVLDLGGRFVMPGFNDAHMHLTEAGFKADRRFDGNALAARISRSDSQTAANGGAHGVDHRFGLGRNFVARKSTAYARGHR